MVLYIINLLNLLTGFNSMLKERQFLTHLGEIQVQQAL